MTLPGCLFGRTTFVRAEYTPDGEYRAAVYIRQGNTVCESAWDDIRGVPVIVAVCGHGVVAKADESEVAARVRSDGETFVWSSSAGRTSFVRRERLQGVLQELATRKIVPVEIVCMDAAADFGSEAAIFALRFRESLRWKTLLGLTDVGSALAQALVRRLAFPVLGAFLLLLTANMLLLPRLNARRQQLQAALANREQTASASTTASVRQRKLLDEFSARPATPHAILCDRMGRAVPEQVRLTSFDVEPLSKRFEAGVPLERREGVAEVCGVAPSTEGISLFVQRLSGLGCCRDVQLTNVEKERATGELVFRIELRL